MAEDKTTKNTSATSKPAAKKPATSSKPTTSKPAASKSTTSKSATSKPAASKSTTSKSATSKPAASKSTTSKSTTSKSATSKPAASKSAAKKPKQNAVDTAVEQPENTVETAAVADQPVENSQPVQEPETKKNDNVEEQPVVEEEQKAQSEQQPEAEQEQDAEKAEEQSAVADEQPEKSEDPVAAQQTKTAKASGKKFPLSRNMIIILSCVLVLVIVGIVLAVCLTSCNSDGKNNKKYYTVTFLVDDEEVASYTLLAGEKITRPKDDPIKEMFIFEGWYWNNPNAPGEKQKFVFDTAISQDMTIYALFNGEISAKIEFDPNGGAFADGVENVVIGTVGSKVTAPAEPERYGYNFDGWYADEDCVTAYAVNTFPMNDLTLYAGWEKDANFVYVTYYGNDEILKVDLVKRATL